MSYCRFSSDNWKSDVYAYADASGGWTVHVAASRTVGPIPEVDNNALLSDDFDAAAFAASYQANINAVMTAERIAIDHPEAGATRNFSSPGELADYLDGLASTGLHIPEGVVADLRDEQENDQ